MRTPLGHRKNEVSPTAIRQTLKESGSLTIFNSTEKNFNKMKQEQIKRDTVVSFGDFLNNDATPDAILK